MPKAFIHLKQAEFNEKAAQTAAQSGNPDWAITMCFYAALHYVKAYEIHNGDNIYRDYQHLPTQHERCLAYVYELSDNKYNNDSSFAAYETLYEASLKARYLKDLTTSAKKHFFNQFKHYFQLMLIVKKMADIN